MVYIDAKKNVFIQEHENILDVRNLLNEYRDVTTVLMETSMLHLVCLSMLFPSSSTE